MTKFQNRLLALKVWGLTDDVIAEVSKYEDDLTASAQPSIGWSDTSKELNFEWTPHQRYVSLDYSLANGGYVYVERNGLISVAVDRLSLEESVKLVVTALA